MRTPFRSLTVVAPIMAGFILVGCFLISMKKNFGWEI